MSSKQLSSPPPTQPRRSYENAHRTKHHEQMDIRYNSHTASGREAPSPYYHYPAVTNRSHYSNHGNFAYTSSAQGVYHQAPPVKMTPPPLPVHSRHNRQIDSRDQSHY
ncbi:unnamed protein product, partial [Rotaria magnacalcarata]